ncbi:HIT domain-containing protein [Rhodococcus sp. WS4]|nr:HIT domain-containing protein [Rhodococcus sp. WS4]
MTPDCAICDKHRNVGPLVGPRIFQNDLLVVTHRPALSKGAPTVPGYLFVETRRHVANLQSLHESEVRAVAHAAWCAARALESELSPQFVFSALAGRSVSHFHQHIFVRPVGTPDATEWNDVDSWADAPRVDAAELEQLCTKLATYFTA